MRQILVIAAVIFALGAGVFAVQQGDAQITGPVRVTMTTATIRTTPYHRADVLLVWNRNQRATPIGHAVLACAKIHGNGILGEGGISTCIMSFVLPRGKIMAAGELHNYQRFTFSVTGGTGVYVNAGGTLFVSKLGPGVLRALFTLE